MLIVDYGWKLPERRNTQVKHRNAQNYEIMLLEETKKYFGMPSAPKISKISEEETNRDLALMRVFPQNTVLIVATSIAIRRKPC